MKLKINRDELRSLVVDYVTANYPNDFKSVNERCVEFNISYSSLTECTIDTDLVDKIEADSDD